MTRITRAGPWEAVAAVAWLLLAPVSAQTSSASFVYPQAESTGSPRLTINVFDTVNVEWDSNYDKAFLYLWCDDGPRTAVAWFGQSVDTTGELSYTPSLQSDTSRDWSNPFACHFDLLYTESPNRGFQGSAINITSERNKAASTFNRQFTSVALSTTSRATSTITSNSLASIVSPTAGVEESNTASPSSTSSSSSESTSQSSGGGGLSTGAKAGIAVGVVVAVIAIAGVGYLFYRNSQKLKKLESSMRARSRTDDYKPPAAVTYAHQPVEEQRPYVPPVELDNHQRMHELLGSESMSMHELSK